MKALVSSLLLSGLLLVLAPEANAQRVLPSRHSNAAVHGRESRSYASSRVWVPGYYETIHERVWVPGRTERVWVEPVFRITYDSRGKRVRVLASAGHYETVCHPGGYEVRAVRVYRPGHWIARRSCDD